MGMGFAPTWLRQVTTLTTATIVTCAKKVMFSSALACFSVC